MGLLLKIFVLVFIILAVWIAFSLREPSFDEALIGGKRVLVTGASSGIGEQMAYHYARLGASVVITARREELLKKVVDKCKETAPPNTKVIFDYIAADMNKLEDAEKVINFAVKKLGGLDQLILNHAFLHKFDVWTGDKSNLTMLSKMMNVNFHSMVHLASYSIPELTKSKGSITVVSSAAGKYANPFMTAYSASKHALNGFFGGLRNDFKMAKPPIEVSVTYCNLGLIATDAGINLFTPRGLGYIFDLTGSEKPSDAGYAIIKSTTLRQREIYFPRFKQMLEFLPFVKELFSERIDKYMVELFQGIHKEGLI